MRVQQGNAKSTRKEGEGCPVKNESVTRDERGPKNPDFGKYQWSKDFPKHGDLEGTLRWVNENFLS